MRGFEREKGRPGFQTKFVLLLLGLLTFTGLAFTAFNIESQKNLLREGFEQRAETVVTLLSQNAAEYLMGLDIKRLKLLLDDVLADKDVEYAYFLDEEGRILTDGSRLGLRHAKLSDPVSLRAVAAETLLKQREGDLLDITDPVYLGATKLGGTRIGFSTETLEVAISGLHRQGFLLGGGYVAVGIFATLGFLFYFRLRKIKHHSNELIGTTERIATGDFNESLASPPHGELERLGAALERMRKNLRDTTVSRDYVDNILRSMIDSVIVASEDGRIQTVNGAICNLLGYKAEELLGRSIQKVIAEPEGMDGTGEKPSESREVERLIEEGSIKNSERAYVAKDGRKIPVSFSGALMTDGGDRIEGLVFVAQDITERKRSAEELARQTSRLETLSQLTRRITSTLDSEDVLNAVAEAAGVLLHESDSRIYLLKEGTDELIIQTGWGTAYRKDLVVQQGRIGEGLTGWIAKTRLPLFVEDISSDPRLLKREEVRREGLVSFIGVPLLSGKKVLGVLMCLSRERRHFTQADQDLLQALGDQAVIAIEQARHHEATLKELKERKALFDSAQNITSGLNLQGVLDSIVKESRGLLGANRCAIVRVDEENGSYEFLASSGLSETYREDFSRAWKKHPTMFPLWQAFLKGNESIIPNINKEPSLKPVRDLMSREGFRSLALFPLQSRRRNLGGLIFYHDQERHYSPGDRELARTFASYAVVAIENATLYRQAKDTGDYLNNLIESAGDALVTVDEDDRVTYWNNEAETLYGYKREETLGKSISFWYPPDRKGERDKLIERVRNGEVVKDCETQRIKKDGTPVDVSLTLSSISDGQGPYKGFIGIAKDITERKRAEKALLEAQRQVIHSEKLASIGQLTAGICHEVLNPLNVVSMEAQLALRTSNMDPETKELAQVVLRQVQRIVTITDSLRRFSRREKLEKTYIQVNEIIEETLSLLRHEFRLTNISLQKQLSKELPPILADRSQLSQAFLNLISNAKDAMPEGGSLMVLTQIREMNGHKIVEVSFSDTGCGISRENLSKIFDPFFTTKPQDQGTGLGLSISYGIVESHNGKTTVESEEEKGSTFRVELLA